MDSVVSFLRLALALLPLVVQAVKTVEEAIPVSGAGPQKLEMVRSMLQSAINTAEQIGPTFEQLWPALQRLVESTVSAFNVTGVFRKA